MFQTEIAQMMHTFGEIRHPIQETTQLVEDIVRSQMAELVIQGAQISRRRSSRYLSHEDLIFLIRRDRMKVGRLTAYLSWRKVRKVANRAGNAGDNMDDEVDQEDEKIKRQKIRLPWDLTAQFDEVLLDADSGDEGNDLDDLQYFYESRFRLQMADQLTKSMSQEEYVAFAECRQASFTYKKQQRFKEWLNMDKITGTIRTGNDVIDVLGFLAYEIVRALTEQALLVKQDMERREKLSQELDEPMKSATADATLAKISRELTDQYEQFSIFTQFDTRRPLQTSHIMEAFRKLQANEVSYMFGASATSSPIPVLRSFSGGLVRTKQSLI